MKAMILVGSGDIRSHSAGLGEAIETKLRSMQVETKLVNLVESGLPLYDRIVEREQRWDDLTKQFLDDSRDTDIFVWVTPIYHNSFSGRLKNALDWQHTKFPGKVVGLASNGGNRSPQAVDQLMIIARSQHLISGRVRVCTQEDDYDEQKRLANPAMLERVDDFCTELADLAGRIV